MTESGNQEAELEQVLEGFNRIGVDRKEIRNNLEGSNWWENNQEMAVTPEQLRAIVDVAISSALKTQQKNFEKQVEDLNKKFNECVLQTPEVETYADIEIVTGRQCDAPLDIVKSLPDFEGKQEKYVSWRQAAHIAYRVFEQFEGSSQHYQAVAIIRNKIKGPADTVLSSFNTVLNFKAIIARLDFTYSDKRPIYLIEQELSILRQGNMSLLEFYDEVEKKLTLLTNKTIMTYDRATAGPINEKYRMDALRVFISGTKKSLSDVLFSARPSDLPSALALAQEVESNHERYLFASNYARCLEDKERQKNDLRQHNRNSATGIQNIKNPHFFKRQNFGNRIPQKEVLPIDNDVSMRTVQSTGRQPTNRGPSQGQYYENQVPMRHGLPPHDHFYNNQAPGQAVKRQNSWSARFTGPKQQRINHVSHENATIDQEDNEYQAELEASEIDTEDCFDQINFLVKTPCYHS